MEGRQVPLFIADASVVVKWFVDEDDSDKARKIKRRYEEGKLNLVTPRLVEYEVSNALRFHPIAKRTTREVLGAISVVRRLAIMVDPSEGAWAKAIELSLSEGISVYDAIYLALAAASQGKMVTSDVILGDKLSENARINLVLLSDLAV